MSGSDLRLPPLKALQVFATVMTQGSFRAAADTLRVSPQAVSQQVKLLEDRLGVTLFSRKARLVEPTEAAVVLSHYVSAGLAEFEEGVRRLRKADGRLRININVSPYFATRFLVQRLETFRAQHPGVDLRMTTVIGLPDFARDEVDVSIQWGFSGWEGYECHLLIPDPKIICCAPDYAPPVRTAQDLAQAKLLHTVRAPALWTKVLRHLQVDRSEGEGMIEVHDAATMRRATRSGLGVGLISELDAREDIAAGRLVAPLGFDAVRDLPAGDVPGFYLVFPRSHKRVRMVAEFCAWVRSEDWSSTSLEV
jgi:LysR family glycine cleavage system transcriptional activator